jgi:hypothetical protein
MFLRCPGSIQMSQKVEERRDSEAAAEGTVAHHVREMVLEVGFDLDDFLGLEIVADGFTFEVDEDMIEHLRPGIEWVQAQPGRVINEFQVDLSRWMPGQFGTLDVGIISDDLITINDLKYGMGVPVDPVRHEPTMAYALALWDNVARHETDATEFLIVIDQPRNDEGGGEWRTTLEELLEFGEEMRAGFEAAQAPDAPLHAGEKQCMFCPAKGVCPEYARWSMDQFDLVLDDLDDGGPLTPADITKFSSERRAAVARNYGLLKKWLDSVHGQVLNDALCGQPTPGLKAVSGRRGPRKWINEKRAKAKLLRMVPEDKRAELYTEPALKSPTQIEKLFPKEQRDDLELLWTQDEGKPSLAPEDSDKPAVTRADMLDDLD